MSSKAAAILSRTQIADGIVKRMDAERERAALEYHRPDRIPSFAIGDLLPVDQARVIYEAFPPVERMVLKHTPGQLKYVGYQMDAYDPLLEEIIYAFQDARVVSAIASITGIADLLPDERLYAGGISLMTQGQYLN